MALKPDDIVNYEFKQALRGYSIPEVDDLLDRVADQVERHQADIDDLRRRLRDTEARLAAAVETESTLKRTFVTAQDAAERALDDAREQADELRGAAEREVTEQLEQARSQAERLVTDAQAEAERLVTGAQDQAEGLSAGARSESERLVTDARSEAERLVADARASMHEELASAQERRAALTRQLDELAELERQQRSSLRRRLQGYLAALDNAAPITDQGRTAGAPGSPDQPADAVVAAGASLSVGVGGDTGSSDPGEHDGSPHDHADRTERADGRQ